MVRALCLNVAAPSSDLILTSGLDLLLVVPDSTLPLFVNSQTGCLLPVGILHYLSSKSELFLSDY